MEGYSRSIFFERMNICLMVKKPGMKRQLWPRNPFKFLLKGVNYFVMPPKQSSSREIHHSVAHHSSVNTLQFFQRSCFCGRDRNKNKYYCPGSSEAMDSLRILKKTVFNMVETYFRWSNSIGLSQNSQHCSFSIPFASNCDSKLVEDCLISTNCWQST